MKIEYIKCLFCTEFYPLKQNKVGIMGVGRSFICVDCIHKATTVHRLTRGVTGVYDIETGMPTGPNITPPKAS